jgi:hypothetical protein
MRFVRVANNQTASKVLNDLKMIPQKLIDITSEFGTRIYCFNDRLKPSYIGLVDKDDKLNDGRSLDETSHYNHQKKAIYIFDYCIKDMGEKAYSTIIHEYAHALDHALGCKIKQNEILSMVDAGIIKRWEKQKGLDCYANIDPLEYFAQAFMAYMYSNLETYKPQSYREHTRQELKEKDSDMYYYLKNLIEN